MKLALGLVFATTLLAACNGQALQGKVESGTSQASPESANAEQPGPAQTPAPQQAPEGTVTLQPATKPSVIAGASLTCKPIDGGGECETFNDAGAHYDIPDSKTYIIDETLKWSPIEVVRVAVGKIQVHTSMKSFGVGIARNNGKDLLGAWVTQPPANLVGDGSFEQKAVSIATYYSRTGELAPWYNVSENPECNADIIDIHSEAYLGTSVPEGKNFVDFHTGCTIGKYDEPRDNSSNRLSQQLKTRAGELYQFSYQVRSNPSFGRKDIVVEPYDGLFEARFGDFVIPSLKVPANDPVWKELQKNAVGGSEKDVISFVDNSREPYGFGVLLDNVRVYPLGFGPETELAK